MDRKQLRDSLTSSAIVLEVCTDCHAAFRSDVHILDYVLLI